MASDAIFVSAPTDQLARYTLKFHPEFHVSFLWQFSLFPGNDAGACRKSARWGRFDDPATPLTAVFSIDDLNKLGAQPWTVAKVGMMKGFQILGILNDVGTLEIVGDSKIT